MTFGGSGTHMQMDKIYHKIYNWQTGLHWSRPAWTGWMATTLWLLVLILPTNAVSQTLIGRPASPDEFFESFDPYPKTSGSPLVGLSIEAPGKPDLEGITFQLPPFYGDHNICVRANSVDGRYSADNPFSITQPASPAQAPLIRLEPLTKNHKKQLQAYDAEALAIRIYKASKDHCHTPKAQLFPSLSQTIHYQTAMGRAKPLILNAKVNSRARETQMTIVLKAAEEEDSGKARTLDGQCETVNQGSRIAFDRICRLTLPSGAAGQGELTLTFDDGFGQDAVSFPVWLPIWHDNNG